jgi:hypothetical protein
MMMNLTGQNDNNNFSAPVPALFSPLTTVDWKLEEQERRSQLLASLIFYAHLFLLIGTICLFCWVRALRRSGCLTQREADLLLDRTRRTLGPHGPMSPPPPPPSQSPLSSSSEV